MDDLYPDNYPVLERATATPTPRKNRQPRKAKEDLGVSNPEAQKRKEELAGCKEAPKSSKGPGGSRPFIPWCSKR